jgi:hypothetical protein|tara:strand:+ start:837 stop:1778 length:942 start_codon:yes stop_codon:yes gene_type:complete
MVALGKGMVLGRLKEIWQRKVRFQALGFEKAGFMAEAQVGQLIEAGIDGTCWRVFHGPRIPAPKEGRCREADFIVVGPAEVWMVECKHWSGHVEMRGTDVIQHRRNDNGELNHKDTFGIIAHKGNVLAEYHGAVMPEVTSFVVFSNHNLELPDEVANRVDCFRQSDLLAILPSEKEDSQTVGLSAESAALVESLETLGTWDLVHLYGGKEYNGDLKSVAPESGVVHGLFESRTEYDRIDMETERSWMGIFRGTKCEAILSKNGIELKRCAVNPDAEIVVRRAGKSEDTSVKWRHVTAIDLLSNPDHHYIRKES